MPVYLLRADQCPPIQVPAALFSPAAVDAGNSATWPPASEIVVIERGTGADKINRNAGRTDLAARYGGARAYAVTEGLALSAGSGLILNAAAGAFNLAGHIVSPTALAQALPANQYDAGDITKRVHVWLLKTLGITLKTDLTIPASVAAYLGSARTNASALVDEDHSGRLELRGGMLWRRTGDAGQPLDTPPAGLALLTRTLGGLYLWDGAQYTQLGPGMTPSVFKTVEATASGNTTLWTPASGKKFRLMGFRVDVTGNAALASGAELSVGLQDGAVDMALTSDLYAPGTAVTTGADNYAGPWINLGSGFLSAAANNALSVNLSAALTSGKVRVTCCGSEE